MRLQVLGVFVMASLGAWPSQAQAPSPPNQTDPAFRQAYETAFRASFRTKFVEQCVAGGSKAASAGYDLTAICSCAADRLLKNKNIDELSRFSSEPGYGAEMKAVMTACVNMNSPVRPSGA